jgi:hypothetical protein
MRSEDQLLSNMNTRRSRGLLFDNTWSSVRIIYAESGKVIIIVNQIILCDATIRVLIFQRLLLKSSTLTNEINENLSLLSDG